MDYVTLHAAKHYLKLLDNTTEDDLISVFIHWATAHIENYKSRHYDPRIETRRYDLPASGGSTFGVFETRLQPAFAEKPLRLDDDLLEVESLENGDGDEITDYVLEPANSWPKMRIRLVNGETWRPASGGQQQQVIALKATYGTHDRYSNAWKDSGQTVQDDPLSISASTIVVGSIAAFEPGQLLRIDDEFALLLSAEVVTTTEGDTETNTPTLTVERAYNGSTAASHSKDTAIRIWQVQGNVTQACLRLVKWRYTQKDVDTFDKTYNGEAGITIIPTAVPVDVLALLGAPKAAL